MAVKAEIKRRISGDWETIHPQTEIAQITDIDSLTIDNLNDISDVNAPSPSDGQALIWDAGTAENPVNKWVPGTVAVDISGKVDKVGDEITGTLEFKTSDIPIKLQQDHFVYRKFDPAVTESVVNSNTAYILLCRNAGGNDVNGTITMDRTSGLRHASSVDILISAGSSAAPVGTMRSMATAGSAGVIYKLVTLTYSGNSFVALYIYNPDSYYDTSGMYFTGRIKTTDTANEFKMLYPADVSDVADFDTNASHLINGQTIWHAGNAADADTKVSKSGDTMTGNLVISKADPVIVLKDTSESNDTDHLGYLSFQDSANVEKAWLGFGSSGNTDFSISNGYGGDINLLGGNVGIGTASPDTQLHIAAPLNVAPKLRLELNDSGLSINSGQEYGAIQWEGNDAQGSGVRADIRVFGDGTSGQTYMTFGTMPAGTSNATSATEAVRINSGGNVQISGTAPLAFTGNGNTGTYDRSVIYANINNTADSTLNGIFIERGKLTDSISAETRNFVIGTRGGSAEFILNKDGNVGIGTTSPAEKLHIEGSLLVDAFNAGSGTGIFFREGFTASNKYNMSILAYDDGDGSADSLDINAYDGITFNTGSNNRNPRMTIDVDGNVGIGTSSPSQRLDVSGGVQASGGFIVGDSRFNQQSGYAQIVTGGNELVFDTGASTLYFNYRLGTSGVAINTFLWKGGSSSTWANHQMGSLTANGTVTASTFSGSIATSGDGQTNTPFRLASDYNSYMVATAGNTWGLFWAGNVGAKYGTNGTGGPGNIWGNSGNPNEFTFVGADSTRWTLYGNTGDTWQSGSAFISGQINLQRGGTDFSNYIRSQNYPSRGYTGATDKYWIEYGSKGGHHFVVDTDGGTGGGANAFDNFTVWKGAVDGPILFQVNNSGGAIFNQQVKWGASSTGDYSGNPRAAVIGYSGGNYGNIGYGWVPTSTSGNYTSAITDLQSRVMLYDGIVVYGSGSSVSAGSTVPFQEVLDARTSRFAYKGNTVWHAGNLSFSLVNTTLTITF